MTFFSNFIAILRSFLKPLSKKNKDYDWERHSISDYMELLETPLQKKQGL